MKNKIICVYPQDSTTDFLQPIVDTLSATLTNEFDIIRIEPNQKAHQMALYQIDSCEVILFMGHGNTIAFHGARMEDDEFYSFLNTQNIGRYYGKSIIGISCESATFLSKFAAESGILNYIGFGDIITEPERFYISESEDENIVLLQKYKNIFVRAVSYAFKSLKYSNSFSDIYKRLQHSLNQQMIELVLNHPSKSKRDLADMIFNLKKEIRYHKQSTKTIDSEI